MIFSDLPPSQGGKYTGFGNTMNPPPRSMSTNDFMDASLNGITNVRKIVLKAFFKFFSTLPRLKTYFSFN